MAANFNTFNKFFHRQFGDGHYGGRQPGLQREPNLLPGVLSKAGREIYNNQ